MHKLDIIYNNLDIKNLHLPKNNNEILKSIKKSIEELAALKIVYNESLLQYTINKTNTFSNKKKIFIVFGTGGSNLGSKAIINFLPFKKNNIFFYDNIDPIYFENFLNKFNLEEVGFIIISKSGSTPETLSQFGCLIEIFEKKNKSRELYNNCLIITESTDNPLRSIATKNNCNILDHEKNIGGRYSVFSNVGIVPSILAGANILKLYDGVKNYLSMFFNGEINDSLTAAQYLKFNTNNKIFNSVLMTYSDSLNFFGKWYLQLWSESLGKDGKGINPIHSIGTIDQHSQLQLYLDGPKDKFFTFITTEHSGLGLRINQKIMEDNNMFFLAGKTMGDLMQAEQKATIDTFQNKGLHYRTINLKNIDEFYLGQLMTHFIIETIAMSFYLKVNPFNQPAVEYGKTLTKKYLS